jgi:hypothetical protein
LNPNPIEDVVMDTTAAKRIVNSDKLCFTERLAEGSTNPHPGRGIRVAVGARYHDPQVRPPEATLAEISSSRGLLSDKREEESDTGRARLPTGPSRVI